MKLFRSNKLISDIERFKIKPWVDKMSNFSTICQACQIIFSNLQTKRYEMKRLVLTILDSCCFQTVNSFRDEKVFLQVSPCSKISLLSLGEDKNFKKQKDFCFCWHGNVESSILILKALLTDFYADKSPKTPHLKRAHVWKRFTW